MTSSLGRIALVGLLLTLVHLPSAQAAPCQIDDFPAATLLVPHFSVDLDSCDATRSETVVAVTNIGPDAEIAHVTLWTDWGVPVVDFDIYLTGYDVQSFAMGAIFCDGVLPQTGSAVSPHGAISGSPIAFPSCNNSPVPGQGPNYSNPFSGALLMLLEEWFTGKESTALGTCAGADRGDNVARGYITIDVVNDCTLSFPSDPDYYTSGILSVNNTLVGDVIQFDGSQQSAWRTPVVHIQSASSQLEPGDHTFYGRYNNASAADLREPLPSTFQSRFVQGGRFDETELLVWRERSGPPASVACGTTPGGIPIASPEALWFDEQESVVLGAPSMPLATQAFKVSEDGGNPYNFGFGFLNLQHDGLDPIYNDGLAQGWVTVVHRASGLYDVAAHAVPFDSLCPQSGVLFFPPSPFVTPTIPGLFGDGFESGDTSAWTLTVP